MPTMAFDTHHAVKTIRSAGASEPLAEAIVKSLRPDTYEPDLSDLATKTDLATVESNLNAKIAAVEKSVATVDTKITMLMWMIGVLGLGAIVAQVLHNTHLL